MVCQLLKVRMKEPIQRLCRAYFLSSFGYWTQYHAFEAYSNRICIHQSVRSLISSFIRPAVETFLLFQHVQLDDFILWSGQERPPYSMELWTLLLQLLHRALTLLVPERSSAFWFNSRTLSCHIPRFFFRINFLLLTYDGRGLEPRLLTPQIELPGDQMQQFLLCPLEVND